MKKNEKERKESIDIKRNPEKEIQIKLVKFTLKLVLMQELTAEYVKSSLSLNTFSLDS